MDFLTQFKEKKASETVELVREQDVNGVVKINIETSLR